MNQDNQMGALFRLVIIWNSQMFNADISNAFTVLQSNFAVTNVDNVETFAVYLANYRLFSQTALLVA